MSERKLIKAQTGKSKADSRVGKAAKAPLTDRKAMVSSVPRTGVQTRSKGPPPVPPQHRGKIMSPMFGGEAPAAISTMSKRHFEMSGDLFSGVRCRVLEPFSGVAQPQSSVYDMGSSSYPGFQISMSIDGKESHPTRTPYSLALNPIAMPSYFAVTDTTWDTGVSFSDSNVLTLIAQAFSRYKVHSLKLHYRPACPTDTPGLFTLGYSEDCSHPLIGISEFSTANYPSQSTIENGSNSITFAPWLPWSMAMPVDSAPKYLSVDGVYAAGTTSVVYDAADIRHTNFGALCLLSSTKTSSTALRVGEMYWELDIELYDAVPLQTYYWIPLLLSTKMIGHGFGGRSQSRKLLEGALLSQLVGKGYPDHDAEKSKYVVWEEITEEVSDEEDSKIESKDEKKVLDPVVGLGAGVPTLPPTPSARVHGLFAQHAGSAQAHKLTSFRQAGL